MTKENPKLNDISPDQITTTEEQLEKNYRRLATRFDKLAQSFRAFLTLASIMVWLA